MIIPSSPPGLVHTRTVEMCLQVEALRADPEIMISRKRRTRCQHSEKTVLTIAGIVKEVCVQCGEITLIAIEWESEFELPVPAGQ